MTTASYVRSHPVCSICGWPHEFHPSTAIHGWACWTELSERLYTQGASTHAEWARLPLSLAHDPIAPFLVVGMGCPIATGYNRGIIQNHYEQNCIHGWHQWVAVHSHRLRAATNCAFCPFGNSATRSTDLATTSVKPNTTGWRFRFLECSSSATVKFAQRSVQGRARL